MTLGHFAVLVPLLLTTACATSAPRELAIEDEGVATQIELPANVRLRRLSADIWVHVTENEEGIGANGLLIVGETSSVLVDTGWTEAQTRSLMRWAAEEQFRPIQTAVVTHSHQDRMGGIAALLEQSVTVIASGPTAERARAKMLPQPTEVFEGVRRFGEVEVFFPGAAHVPDNIVVWLPEKQILFGGCMVRSAATDSLGPMEEASLEGWYHAIRKLRDRYPSPQVVVPGHGKPGGAELYKHTLELIAAKGGSR